MNLSPITEESALHIAHHLRAWDRRECFATRWTDDPNDLAADALRYGAFSWAAWSGRPVAAFGGVPVWPGVWSMWLFATDEWPSVAIPVTKFVRRVMIPKLWASGAHRLECRAMNGHPSGPWLEWMGARREAVLSSYGKGGEDFLVYAIVRG